MSGLSLICYSTNFIKVQTPCIAIHLHLLGLKSRPFLQQHCHLLFNMDLTFICMPPRVVKFTLNLYIVKVGRYHKEYVIGSPHSIEDETEA